MKGSSQTSCDCPRKVRPGQNGPGHHEGEPAILTPTGETDKVWRRGEVPFPWVPGSAGLSDPARVDVVMIVVFLVAPIVIIAGSLAVMTWRGRKRRSRGW